MRFKEFNSKRTDERMPAIGTALKTVGGAAIQATRNAAAMGAKAVQGAAKGVKTVGSTAKAVAQTQAGQQTPQDTTQQIAIPAVGSEIVLPDLDTKRPGSFTVRSMKGNEVELEPVTTVKQTNQPKVSVRVNRRDLENTLKAVSPQSQDKRTL